MTAYGWAEKRSSIGSITVEIQSLNRKFLDVSVSIPKELSMFETGVRQLVASVLQRGRVSIKISAEFEESIPIAVIPNIPLARQIRFAWKKLADDLLLEDTVDLNVMSQMSDVFQFQVKMEEEVPWRNLLNTALNDALANAQEMRMREGDAIFRDFLRRLDNLSQWIEKVHGYCPVVKKKYREKLKQKLSDFIKADAELEERLLREICLFAEKMDIAEEIIRFQSHIEQFRIKMANESGPLGKTLEFLLQEMQREVNTLGSKAQDLNISKLVVEMKSELERIREQVQNVE